MPTALRRELGHFGAAAQFLTRLPLPDPGGWEDPNRLARAARYFALVGLGVGAAGALVWAAAMTLGMPPLAAAGLAITAQILLTGALHEDGLADTADGLGAGATRERALEIMRDSRIGSYGAIALILSILLRISALAALPVEAGAAALIVAATLSRAGMTALLAALPYARSEGAARGANDVGALEVMVAVGTASAAALATGGAPAVLGGIVAWVWMRWRLAVRLGGHTGDGLGATGQLMEILALLACATAWA